MDIKHSFYYIAYRFFSSKPLKWILGTEECRNWCLLFSNRKVVKKSVYLKVEDLK